MSMPSELKELIQKNIMLTSSKIEIHKKELLDAIQKYLILCNDLSELEQKLGILNCDLFEPLDSTKEWRRIYFKIQQKIREKQKAIENSAEKLNGIVDFMINGKRNSDILTNILGKRKLDMRSNLEESE